MLSLSFPSSSTAAAASRLPTSLFPSLQNVGRREQSTAKQKSPRRQSSSQREQGIVAARGASSLPELEMRSPLSSISTGHRVKNVASVWPSQKQQVERTSHRAKHSSSSVQQVELPDCLAQTPMASLRSAVLPTPPVQHHSNPFILPNNLLHRLSPFQVPRLASRPTSRFYSVFLQPRHNPGRTTPLYALQCLNQSRTMVSAGASSQNLLAHMEQTANNNPSSASAQNAFYSALLRADMPQIVIERYQNGRFATNDACQSLYQKALEKVVKNEGMGSSAPGDQVQQSIASAIAARAKGGVVSATRMGTKGTGEKSNPMHVVVDESTGESIFKWIKFFAWFCLIGYVTLFCLSLAVETSGLLKKVGASPNAEAQPQQQTVRFSDVHGCDEAKEEVQELVEFLRNPQRFSALGGKLPKGVLLVGPPGTGKTLLARAVAGEAGVPFFYMSGSEFDEIYVGVGAKRVRELFNNARAKAPAIIFIDELDAIGSKRNERDPTYVKQSLNQLLTELDGFSQDTGVIIIAATNFPQLLDKALTRPGRFDRNVVVPLPDVRGRMEILKHHMKKIKVDGDVDESLLARGTTGFSGAELENLVNQAAVRASKNRAQRVSMLDMEWAKDKIMMGAERRSAVIKENDKLMTAYHEAGHALVGFYTKSATPVYKVTIMPRGQALGVTHFMPDMDKVSESRRELSASIDVCMGGKAAEQLVYGDDNTTGGCSADIQNATSTAYRMVCQMGMSPLGNINLSKHYADLSPSTKASIENEVRSMIEEGHRRATDLLTSKRKELDMLANALVEYEELSLEEMRKVLKGEKLQKMKALKNVGIKLPEFALPTGIPPPPHPGNVSGAGPPGSNVGAGAGAGSNARRM